ncbi:glutathione peroxidase [Undibacterium baiyunense]|uniref:Glutathione peroxidase n=1 Tax=Undibacterium baiyunense TaxID=2828731 RepID=A0A941I472_9BURK|nr:glutathione peroxidase [Undibacterium baiyunense]MBR7747620.1 glutathione peroxidase [Undibacterium baiyunense]
MSALAFDAKRLNGVHVDLSEYAGKVALIVNTASNCGYTPQYQGLETLYQEFAPQGFVVLGFPCNQFGQQEPGDATQISQFCERNYGVSFPMFEKVDVNGETAHPLFQYLKSHAPGVLGTEMIKWNFTKFLLRKDGSVFKRYAPQTTPAEIREDILQLLVE